MRIVFYLFVLSNVGCLFSGGSNEPTKIIDQDTGGDDSNSEDGSIVDDAATTDMTNVDEPTPIEPNIISCLTQRQTERLWRITDPTHVPTAETKFQFDSDDDQRVAWATSLGEELLVSVGRTPVVGQNVLDLEHVTVDQPAGDVLQISGIDADDVGTITVRVTTTELTLACVFNSGANPFCIEDNSLVSSLIESGLTTPTEFAFNVVFGINANTATLTNEILAVAAGRIQGDNVGLGGVRFSESSSETVIIENDVVQPPGHVFGIRVVAGPTAEAGGFPYILARRNGNAEILTYDTDTYRAMDNWKMADVRSGYQQFTFVEGINLAGNINTVDYANSTVDFGAVVLTESEVVFQDKFGIFSIDGSYDAVRSPLIFATGTSIPLVIVRGENGVVRIIRWDFSDAVWVSPELSSMREVWGISEGALVNAFGGRLGGQMFLLGRPDTGAAAFGRVTYDVSANSLTNSDFCTQ